MAPYSTVQHSVIDQKEVCCVLIWISMIIIIINIIAFRNDNDEPTKKKRSLLWNLGFV